MALKDATKATAEDRAAAAYDQSRVRLSRIDALKDQAVVQAAETRRQTEFKASKPLSAGSPPKPMANNQDVAKTGLKPTPPPCFA